MQHLTEDQINQLLDNEQEEFKAHLDACDGCNQKYAAAESVHLRLKQLDYHSPSIFFAKNIIELIIRRQALDKSSRFWTTVIIAGMFISLGLAVSFLLYWFYMYIQRETYFILLKWTIIILLGAICTWGLYFLDKWLGHKRVKGISLND